MNEVNIFYLSPLKWTIYRIWFISYVKHEFSNLQNKIFVSIFLSIMTMLFLHKDYGIVISELW